MCTEWSYDCVLYHLGTDIDECNRGLGECELNATCINTFGSYDCMCKSIYRRYVVARFFMSCTNTMISRVDHSMDPG